MSKYLQIVFAAFFALTGLSCSQAKAQQAEITTLRDSLDAVQFTCPSVPEIGHWDVVVKVRTQNEWDNLVPTMTALLKSGKENILVKVTGKNIAYGNGDKVLINQKFPKANIRIDGRKAAMTPYGVTFKRSAGTTVLRDGKKYWTAPYSEFALNDMVTDVKGNEIPLREEVKQVTGDIEKVQEFKSSRVQDIWKFQIDLPDLTEEECKDFYVLMTRDWTSARHKVVMVKDGWLYYHLDSEDLHSDRDPNVDWKQYRVRPRYRLINSPVSQGVHVTGGRIYVPWQYKEVRVNKGGHLITFAYCHFNSLEICNFTLKGSGGDTGIGIYSSTFEQGALIRHNTFRNLSGKAVSTAINRNVMIADNDVTYTRQQAIEAGGTHTAVCRNHLKNIGWMLNTRAITGGGEGMLICDNVIEDFNYSAIAVGSTTPNEKAGTLTYIIERNTIRLSEAFTDNYIQNTLADGGGIYIGPQCTQGIIRNNVVENIKGIHSNRGIFLDDGAKNLAIYGNLIMNTANSYDIDLRLSNGYAAGIPDHNTNNSIFQNIMTGGYRFQDAGEGSNCIGGENVLLGTGAAQKTVVELKHRAADVKVQGSEAAGSRVQSSRVQSILDSMPVDGFVKKNLVKHYGR